MNQTKKMMCAIGFGVASLLAAGSALADDQKMPDKSSDKSADMSKDKSGDMSKSMSAMEQKNMEATVVKVDQAKRHLELQGENGLEFTVQVPKNVKRFNEIKAGDKINIDFYQSVAVSLEKPSTDMSSTKSQTLTESMAGKLPGGVVAHQESGMVDVVKVDKDKNQITVKRPNGDMDVINVKDPDLQSHLSDIKEGDKIQASYTEAAVISFERPNKKTNTKSSKAEDTSQPEDKAM